MRLGQLYGAHVRTEAGQRLGAVHEVYAKDGEVTELGVGAANLLERLFGRSRGRRVKWEDVRTISGGAIVVAEKTKS